MTDTDKPETRIKSARLFVPVVMLFIVAAVAAGAGAWIMVRFAETPFSTGTAPKEFVIAPGDSLHVISRKLSQGGFVSNSRLFGYLVRWKRVERQLKSGEYLLSGAMTPVEILDIIVAGKTRLFRLTVPEGLTMADIAVLVENQGFGTRKAFLDLCRDSAFVKSLNLPGETLEGYLYPDTYFFPRTAGPKDIILTMVRQFTIVYKSSWTKRQEELGFTRHDIVTLASIIEKETGDASERPLISSVFHNRLKQGMKLESDPTVIYGINNFDGNIKRRHLKEMTPWNTYTIHGLPKGPIANPGALALEAALFPAETDFLFFVSKKDTTHHFSTTFQEHNRAVRKYQLNKR